MKSKSLMSSLRTPSSLVSRPDEKELPLPRQTTARSPSRWCSSPRISNKRRSIASFAALCFSGRLLLTIAIGPSNSSSIGSALTLVLLSPAEHRRTLFGERAHRLEVVLGLRAEHHAL